MLGQVKGLCQTDSSGNVDELASRPGPANGAPCSSSREELLLGVQVSTEAVLSQLQPGDPGGAATQELQEAILPSAQRDLEARVDEMALCLAETTGRPPDVVKTEILDALCTLAGNPNVADTRQRLTEGICVNANGLRHSLAQATPGELQTIEQAILATGDQTASGEEPFERVVDQVRKTYGARGPQDLRPPAEIEQQVRQLTNYLAPGLAEAFQKFGLSRVDHEADYIATLRKASVVLVDHGIDTPAKVNKFLTEARAHDDKVAFAAGSLGQAGYGVGMAAFMYAVAPKIASELLDHTGTVRGAIALGAAAGAVVGYVDCIAGSGAGALKGALSYAGSGPTTSDAAHEMHMSEAKDIGVRVGISAAATFAKNALLRAVVPSAIYASAFPAGINPGVRDAVDFAGDAGGALISGGIANVLTRGALDNPQSSDFKLLSQENLPQVIQRSEGPTQCGIGMHALVEYAKGLCTGAIAPSTFAVMGGVITPMVGVLLSINVGAIPGLGLSMAAGKAIPEAMLTTTLPGSATASVTTTQAPILAAEHALKATVSTLMMSVLAAGATGVGNFVGRRFDADCLAAVFGAVRRAAHHLRDGIVPSQEPPAMELTSIRRRTNAHEV